MNTEITVALITSGALIVLALIKILPNHIRNIIVYYRTKKIRAHAIDSESNDESIIEKIIEIAQNYDFKYNHLIKYHDGGKEIHELSVKKITIIKEYTKSGAFKKKKSLWQNRFVDSTFSKMIKFLMLDRTTHITDIEHIPADTGIRKLYNKADGQELLLRELGFIGIDYYFLCFQRERKISAYTIGNIKLTDRQIEHIEYMSNTIWDLCINAKRIG